MASGEASAIHIAPAAGTEDWAWLRQLWRDEWGGEVMVTRGRLYHLTDLAAVIAWEQRQRAGAATYRLDGPECELLSINAHPAGRGIGTVLLEAVEAAARAAGCRRLWLITTNDNLDALRFYQRRGYRLVAVYPGAVDQARALKPAIPTIGTYGIPLRDELELEKQLAP